MRPAPCPLFSSSGAEQPCSTPGLARRESYRQSLNSFMYLVLCAGGHTRTYETLRPRLLRPKFFHSLKGREGNTGASRCR